MKLISFLPVNYQEICPAWTPWHLNEGRKFKPQKNEDYYIEFYRLKLISPCNNQHKYYLHIQAGVLLLKEFILKFHRYNPEAFYKPSDFHHSAVWLKLHANSDIEYLSKKKLLKTSNDEGSKSYTHDSIPNTADRGLFFCFVLFCFFRFRFVLFSFVCWVLFPVHINDHVKDQSMPILWKDKEKLSSLFFCLPKMDEEEIDFKVEAEAVIEDIGFTVKSISVSRKLPSCRECVYLNVLTKECKSLCIELSVLGFRVSYVFFLNALVIHRSVL